MRFYSMYEDTSKVHLLNHFKHLQLAANASNTTLTLDWNSFCVTAKQHTQPEVILYPQFLVILEGEPLYTSKFTADVVCFTGWRPYELSWLNLSEKFNDKLEQKKFFMEHGFLVPECSLEKTQELGAMIIKLKSSSFGKGMHGPFNPEQFYCLNVAAGEYLEEFIYGTILKIGYWNQEVVYLEQQEMPVFEGDGINTLLTLADSRAKNRNRETNLQQLKEVLAFQQLSSDYVLPEGKKVLADFRNESDFAENFSVKEIDFNDSELGFIDDELMELGEVCYAELVNQNINSLFYTVDAILSEDNQLYILEMNPNPTVYPLTYQFMLNRRNKDANGR